MNLGSRWNVIYNKLRNYRYDHWLITDDSVTYVINCLKCINLYMTNLLEGMHICDLATYQIDAHIIYLCRDLL